MRGWSLASNCLDILVSENKVLCHPSSVDSLSTAAGQEDHVSMGGFAARKALSVVRNVEKGQVLKNALRTGKERVAVLGCSSCRLQGHKLLYGPRVRCSRQNANVFMY